MKKAQKTPSCLVYIMYIGDYTTQLCGDFNKPLNYKDPYEPASISWKGSGRMFFFVAHFPKNHEISKLVVGRSTQKTTAKKPNLEGSTGMSCWYLVNGCPNPHISRL